MFENKARYFLERLSAFYEIDIDHKWMSELFNKIGEDVGIKSANTVSVWVKRGNIPDHAIRKLLKLNIPDELKKLYKLDKKKDELKEDDTKSDGDLHGGGGIKPHPEESKLLKQVADILGSETDYSKALEQNINAFHRALKAEEANRRKGERRKKNDDYDGEDQRKGERRRKVTGCE